MLQKSSSHISIRSFTDIVKEHEAQQMSQEGMFSGSPLEAPRPGHLIHELSVPEDIFIGALTLGKSEGEEPRRRTRGGRESERNDSALKALKELTRQTKITVSKKGGVGFNRRSLFSRKKGPSAKGTLPGSNSVASLHAAAQLSHFTSADSTDNRKGRAQLAIASGALKMQSAASAHRIYSQRSTFAERKCGGSESLFQMLKERVNPKLQ